MKSEDVEKVLEVMHQVKPDELSKESKKLYNAIISIADERDEYQAHNIELLSFIRDLKLDKEYRKWRYGKDERKNK